MLTLYVHGHTHFIVRQTILGKRSTILQRCLPPTAAPYCTNQHESLLLSKKTPKHQPIPRQVKIGRNNHASATTFERLLWQGVKRLITTVSERQPQGSVSIASHVAGRAGDIH